MHDFYHKAIDEVSEYIIKRGNIYSYTFNKSLNFITDRVYKHNYYFYLNNNLLLSNIYYYIL